MFGFQSAAQAAKQAKEIQPRVERQELWCHDCERYVQFPIDLSLNGNHVLHCPNCNHEHCRVVENGVITDIRWDSRPGRNSYIISGTVTTSAISTYVTYTSASATTTSNTFLYDRWLNVGTGS